jgi:hypothetical protein
VLNTDRDFTPGVICFFCSDDDGKTWYKTEAELECPFPSNPDGYEEPGLYELPDGRLWCYIRTSLGFQYESFSRDNGITWTAPEPNMFFSSPCSPMHVRDCGELTVAIFNPVPEHLLREESEPWGRTPFVMAFSTDRGLTFKKENGMVELCWNGKGDKYNVWCAKDSEAEYTLIAETTEERAVYTLPDKTAVYNFKVTALYEESPLSESFGALITVDPATELERDRYKHQLKQLGKL